MSEINPTNEHLADPYVLQLIQQLCIQDDRIDDLETENRRMLLLLEHISRSSTQMLDPVRRRGPGGSNERSDEEGA